MRQNHTFYYYYYYYDFFGPKTETLEDVLLLLMETAICITSLLHVDHGCWNRGRNE